jgi:hypothetical protein
VSVEGEIPTLRDIQIGMPQISGVDLGVFADDTYIYIYIYVHIHTHTHRTDFKATVNFSKFSVFLRLGVPLQNKNQRR